jgi:hypothetical protein
MYNYDDEKVINQIFTGRFITNEDVVLRKVLFWMGLGCLVFCSTLIYFAK